MFENPSLVTRIAIGKLLGFAVGLIGLIVIPLLWPDSGWMERIAFLLWLHHARRVRRHGRRSGLAPGITPANALVV